MRSHSSVRSADAVAGRSAEARAGTLTERQRHGLSELQLPAGDIPGEHICGALGFGDRCARPCATSWCRPISRALRPRRRGMVCAS